MLGMSNYPPLNDWYYNGSPWVGHVREPTFKELKNIIEYCGLEIYKSGAHNSINKQKLPGFILNSGNLLAKFLPSTAAHIYVVGRKSL